MILLPNILKGFLRPAAETYILRPAKELLIDGAEKTPPPGGDAEEAPDFSLETQEENEAREASGAEEDESAVPPGSGLPEDQPPPGTAVEIPPDGETPKREPPKEEAQSAAAPEMAEEPKEDPFAFAKVQAEALMRDARREVEEYREKALREIDRELDAQRQAARAEGYDRGYAAGMADAMTEAKVERERLAAEQVKSVELFLEAAARQRDKLLDDTREELKELALTVAEKVIRVSLQNSGDILQRMVDAATDTHRRCEWAHIYVADCDVRGQANTVPELTAALRHISDRVRVIPMADDESGTCIVELPDVIYDASVSTQLGNIREVLNTTGTD